MKVRATIKKLLLRYGVLRDPNTAGMACRLYKEYAALNKSPKSEEDLLKTMIRGAAVLQELGVEYHLGRGTLLGHHRDKKFLPRDNDIDIDVFSDSEIYQIINRMPFELLLINISNGRYQQLVFVDPETDVLFDIWFYHMIRDEYINKHAQGIFKYPSSILGKSNSIEIHGKSFPGYDPDWYCSYWYGKTWRNPEKYSTNWVEFYKKDCVGFQYAPEDNITYINLYENGSKQA